MKLRLLVLCAVLGIANFGCSSMGPEPTPQPAPIARDGGPPVDQGAPVTGGELFNGNY